MSAFLPILASWPRERVLERLYAASVGDVRQCLNKEHLRIEDMLCLLSPVASELLENMAQRAHGEHLRHFGRVVHFFTPLYISDHCTNQCRYCGFNARNKQLRHHLSTEEIVREAQAIAQSGLSHVLLLTGDARHLSSPAYIAEAAGAIRRLMASICVEVYSMSHEEYALLLTHGVDGMTMFQETYNRDLYAKLHPAGPKRDFVFRLEAPGRAAAAGMRSLGIGALLGLDEWRCDAFYTALHAHWLQNTWPAVECSVSVPRIRPSASRFTDIRPVADRDMAQYISALRCFMPRLGITLSTREPAKLRDSFLPLGVSRMSAGVSTAVGTRAGGHSGAGQFQIADTRSVEELSDDLARMGYQSVLKDWEDPGLPLPQTVQEYGNVGHA